jgi:hypothetical protein
VKLYSYTLGADSVNGNEVFEYDAAFSFLAADEPLAGRLCDLLAGHLKTFIYSKEQEHLAGRDGEAKFADVFAQQARVAVILYRQGWGETPWTRIERDAIRNRAFDKGYNFTLWIPLDRPAQMPDYVPKTRLYSDIETFGEKGVAAVVLALAKERGATVTPETLEQKTHRAARAAEAEQRREAFHNLGDGVQRAKARALHIIAEIRAWAEAAGQPFNLEVYPLGYNGQVIVQRDDARRRAISLVVGWRNAITNSTDQSEFDYQLYDGVPDIPGRWAMSEARQIDRTKYYCDLAPSGEIVWTQTRQGSDPITEGQLIEKVIGDFMDKIVK